MGGSQDIQGVADKHLGIGCEACSFVGVVVGTGIDLDIGLGVYNLEL